MMGRTVLATRRANSNRILIYRPDSLGSIAQLLERLRR